MTVFITQAILQSRLGSGGLARIASPIATLNTEAATRITQGCNDANGTVNAAIAGLSLDLSGPPDNLVGIAAALALRQIWILTWSSRVSSGVPKAIADNANKAEEELKAIAEGGVSGDGTATPAKQEAARFSWWNIGDDTDLTASNSRQVTRFKMRRLP